MNISEQRAKHAAKVAARRDRLTKRIAELRPIKLPVVPSIARPPAPPPQPPRSTEQKPPRRRQRAQAAGS